MEDPIEVEALERIGAELGYELALDDGVLVFEGVEWEIPVKRADWDLVRMRHAFPSAAHGDQREKLVYKIVQDAASTSPSILDATLRRELAGAVPLPDAFSRQVVAAAIADEYWTVVQRFPYLVPYHSLLPSLFTHTSAPRNNPEALREARYKLFHGVVLPFLCWTSDDEVDVELVQQFLDVMNSTDDLTQLDELMLEAAAVIGEDTPGPATADRLLGGDLWPEVEAALQEGAFWQPAHDRFQRDLRTVLSMRASMPRRDLIDLLTLLLSLHLALHYYRVAVVLGAELDRALSVSSGNGDPLPVQVDEGFGGPLAGRMKFRVGTRGDRTVSLADPCVSAYRELTDFRLLGLPAAITTMNLAQSLWEAIGEAPARADLSLLAGILQDDPEFAARLDAGSAAAAALYFSRRRPPSKPVSVEDLVEVGTRRPGLFALREAVTVRRRTSLRNLSRDVVNQLVKRDRGSLIRTRGRATFFELDEDLLFLLVKLICGDDQVDFGSFLAGLREYGLVPQDGPEEELLVAALERMGMLRRYSDAGESIYVSHPIS